MSRILFAWQLGSNYGHLTTDLPIALCLRECGHEVSFMVPRAHQAMAAEILAPAGFAFAPMAETPAPSRPAALASYPEILEATGFGDEQTLDRLAAGFATILQSRRIDVLVADHAPLPVLAARLSGVASALIGNGFTVPPLLAAFPSIRPWQSVPESRLRATETAVLGRVNVVAARRGAPRLDRLSQLFAASRPIITTTVELDPYGPRAAQAYVGPVAVDAPAATAGDAAGWPAGARKRIFAYLRASMAGIDRLLGVLEDCDAHVLCAMPGAPPELERHFEGTRLKLVGRALPLGSILVQADVVVGYGGSGLTSAALLAGVPLLLVPQNPEQYLGAAQAERLGCAIVAGPEVEPPTLAAALDSILTLDEYRKAAEVYATTHREHDHRAAARRAAELIVGQARGKPP